MDRPRRATSSTGNDIGTDVTGTLPLGNEIDGVIFSTNASNNTVGGTATGQGNTIAFNVADGVDVDSGTGDSILTNSIFSNGQLGIFLNPSTNANDSIKPSDSYDSHPQRESSRRPPCRGLTRRYRTRRF